MNPKIPASIEYNLRIMNENRSSALHKILAGFFGIVFIVSLVFVGYRIYTKPAYEAHEKEQARILAASVVSLMARRTAIEPGIWDRFSGSHIELMIDHMKIKGNWMVRVNIFKKAGYIEVICSVSSGWNSRSPQSAELKAKIFNDGRSVYYGDGSAEISGDKAEPIGKTHSFRFPDEMQTVPVLITAEEYLMIDPRGKEYLVLK